MEDELQPVPNPFDQAEAPNPLAELRLLLANEDAEYEQLYQALRYFKPRHPMVRTMAIEKKHSRDHLVYQLSKFLDQAEKAVAFEAARAEAKIIALAPTAPEGTRGLEEGGGEEDPETDTPELAKLQERSRLINQRAKLQNTLADQTTDEDRAAVVAQIEGVRDWLEFVFHGGNS